MSQMHVYLKEIADESEIIIFNTASPREIQNFKMYDSGPVLVMKWLKFIWDQVYCFYI